MFKIALIGTALAGTLALGGCASITNGINSVTSALSSSNANQAAANVKTFTTGFVCAIGSISALATNVEAQLKAQLNVGNALVDQDTGIVYVVSASICGAMGGTVASDTVAVPSTASSTLGS